MATLGQSDNRLPANRERFGSAVNLDRHGFSSVENAHVISSLLLLKERFGFGLRSALNRLASDKAGFEELSRIVGVCDALFQVLLCQFIDKRASLHHQHPVAHMGNDG